MAKNKNKNERIRKIEETWNSFMLLVPSEEVARERVYTALKIKGRIVCPCGCRDVVREWDERSFVCRRCKNVTYYTVGTCFENKELLLPRLAAIYFAEQKIPITAYRLFLLADIAMGTARNIVLETALIVANKFNELMASAIGHEFLNVIFRRSSETPARRHPWAEQEEIQKRLAESTPEADDNVTNDYEDRSAEEQLVLSHLSETPTSLDALSTLTSITIGTLGSILTFLELDKLVERMPGDRYLKLKKAPQPRHTDLRLMSAQLEIMIITFIRLHYHGVSRKFLQLYLALWWLYNDHHYWSLGSLADLYLDTPPWETKTLGEYISPDLLTVPNLPGLNLS